MKTNHRLIAFVLFAGLLLLGCSAKESAVPVVPEGVPAGEMTPMEACEFKPADGKTEYSAECGTLVVPENWDKASSRLIALPVVRIPATGLAPAEPVFYLQGGPGQSNFSWPPPGWLLEKHDVVFVGYRGVDGMVTLACPEVTGALKAHVSKDLFSVQARAESVSAAQACATRLQEAGVDLSGYAIPGVIEDMEAARKALGYDRINLLSESYGTRVAQIYAYVHPESLHRLVLIGVNTPGHFIWDPAVLDKMIGHISELCAQDAFCNIRTSNLARTMYSVDHNMPRRWLFFNIDPDSVRLGAQFMFLNNPNMPIIFDAYLAAAEGDPSGLAMLNLLTSIAPIDQQIFGDQASKAGSVDLDKYGGIESVSLGESIMGAPMAEWIWPIAAEWPIDLIPKDLRDFQESNVEMLLVNGTVDFSTPATALDEAKPYFHKAQMILLPEFSHIGDVMTLQPEAFARLVTSYYDTGAADSSLFVYQPVSFKSSMSLTVIAKLLVTGMFALSALIILGLVLVVRRTRRRRIITPTALGNVTAGLQPGSQQIATTLGFILLAALSMVACGPVATPTPPATARPPAPTTATPPEPVSLQAQVSSLEIHVTSAGPAQVNAIVRGNLTESCAALSESQVQYSAALFQITLFQVSPAGVSCVQTITPFETSIPLSVTGLPPGTYTVKANGVSAVFTLPAASIALTPSPSPTTASQGCTDMAAFVSDVTIPDNTVVAAGTPFTKSWRLKNTGSCTWDRNYLVAWISGTTMTQQPGYWIVPEGQTVAPGQTADISVGMTAPAQNGDYTSSWGLKRVDGQYMPIQGGANGNSFYVKIKVNDGTAVADGNITAESIQIEPEQGSGPPCTPNSTYLVHAYLTSDGPAAASYEIGSTGGQIAAGQFQGPDINGSTPYVTGTLVFAQAGTQSVDLRFVGPYPYPNDITVTLRVDGGDWYDTKLLCYQS